MTFHRHLRPLPLPGTVRAPRALFVGRWGALLERRDAPCRTFGEARVAAKAGELLFRATQAGWRLYLVGNEPDVARGRVGDAAWEGFQKDLHAHLAGQGIPLARDYACLDHPQTGKGKHKCESVYRFPNTGALYHALQEDGTDLRASWMISDDVLELAAASRAGVRTLALARSIRVAEGSIEVECETSATSFAEAVSFVLAGDALRRVG
jgi:histidinol phosphatase-like enzyme